MTLYESINKQDFKTDNTPHGLIQWKNTDICIDLHCTCGHHGHYDGEFFSYYECSKCHKKYATGETVKLIELDREQIQEVLDMRGNFDTENDNPHG